MGRDGQRWRGVSAVDRGEQLTRLRGYGQPRQVAAAVELFHAGDASYDLVLIESGLVEVVREPTASCLRQGSASLHAGLGDPAVRHPDNPDLPRPAHQAVRRLTSPRKTRSTSSAAPPILSGSSAHSGCRYRYDDHQGRGFRHPRNPAVPPLIGLPACGPSARTRVLGDDTDPLVSKNPADCDFLGVVLFEDVDVVLSEDV